MKRSSIPKDETMTTEEKLTNTQRSIGQCKNQMIPSLMTSVR